MMLCPLCSSKSSLQEYYQDNRRYYLQCSHCELVMVPDKFHLSANDEKAEYDLHQNQSDDSGYRRFLSRLLKPLMTKLKADARGLDFGCGPGPTLSKMAAEQGIKVSDYDLYYFNQPSLLEKQYDFIIMTEVIEHIAQPDVLLTKLDAMLKQDSILAVMTKRVIDKDKFSLWHYKNDPTHLCFYSIKTFQWISDKLNWRLEIIDNDVVFFYKD